MEKIIISSYLDYVQEEKKHLQEFDPELLGVAGALTLAKLIYDLLIWILSAVELKHKTKIDVTITSKINKIVGKQDHYKIHIFSFNEPNAFTLGGKNLYYTTGLKKIMTEREILSIMLHEVYHSKALHVLKSMAVQYPLLMICLSLWMTFFIGTGAALAIAASAGVLGVFINILVFNIVISTPTILDNITFGKQYEYNADSYAVKLGYGDALISAFKKIQKIENKQMKKCTGVCQGISSINHTLDAHPEIQKRIENILKQKELAKLALDRKVSALKDFLKSAFTTAGV